MKMKRVIYILIFLFFTISLFPKRRSQSLFLNLGGVNAIGGSLNYSNIMLSKTGYFVDWSIGVGTVPMVGGIILPHGILFNLGEDKAFIEFGLWGNIWIGKTNASGYTKWAVNYILAPSIGWKGLFKNGIFFEFYISKQYNVTSFSSNSPVWLGLNIGRRFN